MPNQPPIVKGKSLRRALQTLEAGRVATNLPLIIDTTEFITPDMAQELLKRNKHNRPINWKKVEEYADLMSSGKWALHAQGIIIDADGNILTGQKRLWAVIYSGMEGIYMRISRGSSKETASLLDRGTPQTARDLASRATERKHSPTEASIVRGVCVLSGIIKPSADHVAEALIKYDDMLRLVLLETKGTRKTKAMLMVLSAVVYAISDKSKAVALCRSIEQLGSKLENALLPDHATRCFGRGAAYSRALQLAHQSIVNP